MSVILWGVFVILHTFFNMVPFLRLQNRSHCLSSSHVGVTRMYSHLYKPS